MSIFNPVLLALCVQGYLHLWFHNVRKGLGPALKDRSSSRIDVAGYMARHLRTYAIQLKRFRIIS